MKSLIKNLSLAVIVSSAFFLYSCNSNETIICPLTVYDVDGNAYDVIKIGNQCWTQQNLKTSRYRNDDTINTRLDATQWNNATTGAYAIYDDNSANDVTYGILYNGFAVATGLLCPEGWHIPTDEEFKTLEESLV